MTIPELIWCGRRGLYLRHSQTGTTLPLKSLDTPSHLMFFLYFHDHLNCWFSLKASKLWINIRNYVVNKKVWSNSKYVSYFRFLKVATLCFVDSAANPWPSLNELHDVVTWNGFHFTGVPCQGSFLEFLAFLMGLGPSVVLCRSQVGTQLTGLFDNC